MGRERMLAQLIAWLLDGRSLDACLSSRSFVGSVCIWCVRLGWLILVRCAGCAFTACEVLQPRWSGCVSAWIRLLHCSVVARNAV